MKRRQQNMTTLELLKLGACLLLLAIADGCARPGSGPVVDEQNDMFVSVVPQGFQTRASQSAGSPNTLPNTLAECEKSLKLAACETNAGTSEIADDYSNIQCTSNSLTYVPALLKIAQEMPEKLRPLFCNVERIFISDSITSTAFASPILDDAGVFQGGFIGARKSTFLQTPNIRELATWKEQLNFGGSSEFLKIDPKLVQVDYGLKLKVLDRDGLFYVLVHELGHLVDFKTGINGDCASQFCRPSNGSWASMSWQAASTPLAGLAFFLRDQFCYYGCKKPIAATRAAEIYRSLPASAFVTTYAGQNMREDFAEFFAWSIMTREKGAHLTFTIPAAAAGDEAVVVDMNPAFSANAALKAKLERANQYLQAL